MPSHSTFISPARERTLLVLAASLAGLLYPDAPVARGEDPPPDAVGTIDGAAVAVSGPMRVEIVHGFVQTMLRSGSEVRVNSGTARLELVGGGSISICGPAHFSVLKSGKTLTVALDTGSIHAYLEGSSAVTIYTPQIVAQTLAIGDGPQEALVGFDQAGAMCIRAYRGALRVEQQLNGQSVMVPQSTGVLLPNGQLESLQDGADRCSCDPQLTKYAPPPPVEVSPPSSERQAAETRPVEPETHAAPLAAAPSAKGDEPIYQVFMPPLVYDAAAKIQPQFDPQLIVLVRRVRVRPSLIFQGRVEGESAATAEGADPAKPAGVMEAQAAPAGPSSTAKPAPQADSFANRVRNLVRKLWSR